MFTVAYLGWAFGQPASPYTPSPYVAAAGEALVLRPDGGFVVAGVRREPAAEGGARPGADLFLAWLDPAGALERLVVFGGEGDERLGSAALDAAGAVYLAGSTTGTLPGAMGTGAQFVAKLTPVGEVAWVRRWHGGANAYSAVVALTAEGELLVAGSLTTGEGAEGSFRDPGFHPYYDAYFSRLDEAGGVEWFEAFAVDATQFPTALVPLAGGEVVVVGFGGGDVGGEPLGRSDAFLVAYAPDGERLWEQRFGSPGFDVATAVAVAPDGVIYVTGHTWGRWSDLGVRFRAGEYWFLAAYDMDGERLWLREYPGDATNADGG